MSSSLDVGFYIWIFDSLKNTIGSLRKNEQTIKLGLYKNLKVLLYGAAVFSTIWSIVLTSDKWVSPIFNWRVKWMEQAGFQLLYLTIIMVIGYMFWPNERSSQFAYQFQVNMEAGGGGGDGDGDENGGARGLEEGEIQLGMKIDSDSSSSDEESNKHAARMLGGQSPAKTPHLNKNALKNFNKKNPRIQNECMERKIDSDARSDKSDGSTGSEGSMRHRNLL